MREVYWLVSLARLTVTQCRQQRRFVFHEGDAAVGAPGEPGVGAEFADDEEVDEDPERDDEWADEREQRGVELHEGEIHAGSLLVAGGDVSEPEIGGAPGDGFGFGVEVEAADTEAGAGFGWRNRCQCLPGTVSHDWVGMTTQPMTAVGAVIVFSSLCRISWRSSIREARSMAGGGSRGGVWSGMSWEAGVLRAAATRRRSWTVIARLSLSQ